MAEQIEGTIAYVDLGTRQVRLETLARLGIGWASENLQSRG